MVTSFFFSIHHPSNRVGSSVVTPFCVKRLNRSSTVRPYGRRKRIGRASKRNYKNNEMEEL
ncbi:uncharacterized protein V6R79_023656 [Siganus canaliculatus]